jgi:hypothetical protein
MWRGLPEPTSRASRKMVTTRFTSRKGAAGMTLDELDEMETLAALDEAAAEIERGDVVPAAAMMARLRQAFGMPRRRGARGRGASESGAAP